MTNLSETLLNWIGIIVVISLVFHNIKLIQENLQAAMCIMGFLGFLLVYLLVNTFYFWANTFLNRWIEAFSPKYTLKAAKAHASAVTAGAIKALEKGGQPSPFYWLIWIPFRICQDPDSPMSP